MGSLLIKNTNHNEARPLDPNAPVIPAIVPASVQEEVATILNMTEGEKAIQKIIESIPDEIFELKKPIVIASQKKENTEAGREKTVGEGSMLNFDPTQLHTVTRTGETKELERGNTYLILRTANDENHVEMVEIEIPREGAMLPKSMMFTNYVDSDEKIVELMKKYKLSA